MTRERMTLTTASVLAAAVAAVAITPAAHAAEYTWVPTSGNQNWNNSTHDADPGNDADNWGTGIGGAFPNAAGDVANVNNNITAQVNISLLQPITVGTINLGDADGTSVFTIAGPSLVLDSGAAGAPAVISVRSNGTITNAVSAPLTLNSDLDINLEPSTTLNNKAGLTISGTVATTGHTITVTGGYKGASDGTQMTLGGGDTLIGNGTIINNSDSPLVITGDKASFTGTLVANGQGVGQDANTGTITLTNASVRNAAEIIVNGYNNGATDLGGKLQIGTGSQLAPPANQRLTQNRITMNGGFFNDGGVPLSSTNPPTGNFHVLQTDTVANLDFNSGFAIVNVTASNRTAGNVLNVTTVERGAGATAFFRAVGSQTSLLDPSRPAGYTYVSQMKADNGAALVVGSTDTSGTATRIIPWMVASGNPSNLGITTFATYDDAEGFRILRAGEFDTAFATGANVVRGDISNLGEDWVINSLVHNSTGVQNPNVAGGPERTLTIASGGLIFTANGGGIGAAGNNNGRAGTINFGAAEGVITNAAANTNHIGSVIAGSGGLTKGGSGTLILTGANTFTGPTHVGGGTLQVGDATHGSTLGDDDVFVHAGAVLSIVGSASDAAAEATDVIADDATLDLYRYGLFNGQVNFGAEVIETVGGLSLAGILQDEGYYGSSAAAAAFPTLDVTVNDAFFGGAGLIEVAAIPEPASLAGVLAGAVGLLGRRRRGGGA